jgi:hypothetical protein
MHCGYPSLQVLRSPGFRISAHDVAMLPNPIGLDGVFEAHCPPYHQSMDAAVDAVLAPPLRRCSPLSGPAPFLIFRG